MFSLGACAFSADSAPKPELLESRKIWDAAPHNAFTDLIRLKGAWYCCFREGSAHVSPDGAVRVITSTDGQQWTPAARLTREFSASQSSQFAWLSKLPEAGGSRCSFH